MRALVLFVVMQGLGTAQTNTGKDAHATTEWPQFRGPNASGVAAEDAAPPVEFSLSKRLLWKQALPVGHSSPVVWGDRIFLNSFEPASKKLELICLSAKTGAILWRHAAPPTEIEENHVVSN